MKINSINISTTITEDSSMNALGLKFDFEDGIMSVPVEVSEKFTSEMLYYYRDFELCTLDSILSIFFGDLGSVENSTFNLSRFFLNSRKEYEGEFIIVKVNFNIQDKDFTFSFVIENRKDIICENLSMETKNLISFDLGDNFPCIDDKFFNSKEVEYIKNQFLILGNVNNYRYPITLIILRQLYTNGLLKNNILNDSDLQDGWKYRKISSFKGREFFGLISTEKRKETIKFIRDLINSVGDFNVEINDEYDIIAPFRDGKKEIVDPDYMGAGFRSLYLNLPRIVYGIIINSPVILTIGIETSLHPKLLNYLLEMLGLLCTKYNYTGQLVISDIRDKPLDIENKIKSKLSIKIC